MSSPVVNRRQSQVLPNVKEVEEKPGYIFNHKTLLLGALSRSANKNLGISSFERLEYLGDAVFDVVSAGF